MENCGEDHVLRQSCSPQGGQEAEKERKPPNREHSLQSHSPRELLHPIKPYFKFPINHP
jgi:hypothetical protein